MGAYKMIKIDIEMPKNCTECPLQHDELEYCKIDKHERLVYKYYSKRPEWCPLIEVDACEIERNN